MTITTPAIDRVLAAFTNVANRGGDNWMARCSAHDDGKQSLSISIGRDGDVVLHCHAGCQTADVLAAASLTFADLRATNGKKPDGGARRIVATYPYVDETGAVLFEKVRYEPKDFRVRRPDGKGGYTYSIGDARRVLYRLPELLAAIAAGRHVWICEGEKDCDALFAAGEVATTNFDGAGKWKNEYVQFFAGASLVQIVADDDPVGRKHARAVRDSLAAHGIATTMWLPAKGHKDIADHLGAGLKRSALCPLDDTEEETVPDVVETGLAKRYTDEDYAPVRRVRTGILSDTNAERALLGAALQSDDAIAAARSAGVTPDCFISDGTFGSVWAGLEAVGADAVGVANWVAKHRGGETTQLGELLTTLMAGGHAISLAGSYAAIVVDCKRNRHVERTLRECLNGSFGVWRQRVGRLIEEADAWDATTTEAVTPWVELDAFIDTDEPDHDWLIPGLLERSDRCIITATPGTGKSTLLRQIGVMAASGLHPFTAADIDPVRVLILDVENSSRQIRREIRPLRDAAGSRYNPGMLEIRVFGEAINLADPATLSDIMRHVEHFEPGIICTGPLYKLIGGDPVLEKDARPVADAFDRIRHVCGSAVIIEAHSPYPVGKTTVIRPYGASLWERWPEFGWYFSAAGNIEHWRGQREERNWPAAIERSSPWPWASRHIEPARAEGEEWHGPTKCIEAIVDFLARHPDEEFTGNQLYTRMRADNPVGRGFREQTVREGAEQAANDVERPVTVRNGARNARLFSYAESDGEDEPLF